MLFTYRREKEVHSGMDYSAMLTHSYKSECERDPELPRYSFLACHVFDFTTYDDGMDKFLAVRAIQVCEAITHKKTFEYIESSEENYRWYIAMCNMPFFARKIEWGTSIRGAWWNSQITLQSCGLWDGDDQIDRLEFSSVEWEGFIHALIRFSKGDPS